MISVFNRQLICLLFMGALGHSVNAACTVAPGTVASPILLGTANSKMAAAGGITSARATFSVNCSITLTISLLGSGSTLGYAANNPLVLTHISDSSEQIPYEIASNNTFFPSISNQGDSIGGSGNNVLLSLALLSQQQMQIPLFVRTRITANNRWPRSGQYASSQSLTVTGSICNLLSIGSLCLASFPVNGTVSMPIQIDISKFCEFISVATDVSFGNQSFINQTATQNWTARIQCTNSDSYKIYATAGLHHNGTHRQMDRGGVQKVAYDIYHPSSTTSILSASNPLNRTGTGLAEDLTFPVRIIAGQATPAIGSYQDTLRLVIEY